jgi:hypothetical protein
MLICEFGFVLAVLRVYFALFAAKVLVLTAKDAKNAQRTAKEYQVNLANCISTTFA